MLIRKRRSKHIHDNANTCWFGQARSTRLGEKRINGIVHFGHSIPKAELEPKSEKGDGRWEIESFVNCLYFFHKHWPVTMLA